jgi:hypothetical protein
MLCSSEILADNLVWVFGRPLPFSLTDKTIIVQSFSMEQWIELELTRRFGV